ncbi:MAG TPA: c-type cytochrome biogenesis protein CcmI [Acidocella sp.]|nr:c-type cytochrome biogenesis protein CcmI [Acidocella sp.]
MIFLYMFGLAIILMAPLLLVFGRKKTTRNRREAALALHRAQLEELSHDLADGRIAAPEYGAAKLEVERRLLVADGSSEPAPDGNARFLLIATVVAVPVMAFALYLPGSTPNIPSEPHAQWVVKQQEATAQLQEFITAIKMRLASEDPNSPDASQGQAYLAEALSEVAGTITPEALAYFKQSLSTAPPKASWRPLDEQRIAEATQQPAQ